MTCLTLSSLLLKRHMALRHTTHSIITSYIPWNTSSPLSPLMIPGSKCRPPPLTHPLFPSQAHPPAPPASVLIPVHLWFSVQRAASSQSFSIELTLLICLSASCIGSVCPWCLVAVGRQSASNTRSKGRQPSITPMKDMGGKEKSILVITNAPNYQG